MIYSLLNLKVIFIFQIQDYHHQHSSSSKKRNKKSKKRSRSHTRSRSRSRSRVGRSRSKSNERSRKRYILFWCPFLNKIINNYRAELLQCNLNKKTFLTMLDQNMFIIHFIEGVYMIGPIVCPEKKVINHSFYF